MPYAIQQMDQIAVEYSGPSLAALDPTSRCRSYPYVYLLKEAGTKGSGTARGERKHTTMHNDSRLNKETIFTMEATPLKYGPGASEEAGWELKQMGVGRVMLVSDPGVVKA
jgi:hypothetical protein